jgi:tRNA threonylcarbamoyladenosine biosynthesis protein TsaB
LLKDDAVLTTAVHNNTEEYSSWLLPAVDGALAAGGHPMEELDLFAVASGPGSFTGVRIGLTTVKAWAEVFGKPVATMSRLEVVARQSTSQAPLVAVFINAERGAQRGQIFAALYQRQGDDLVLSGDEVVAKPEDFISWVDATVGSRKVAWVSTDSGLFDELPSWTEKARGEIQQVPCVLAPLIGRIGMEKALRGQTVDALTLDANYVRRSYVEVFEKSVAKAP